MEKSYHINIAKLDKNQKTVVLNILSIANAFLENTKHMLHHLKKIDKHRTGSIAPDAKISKYSTAPFELPEEKACIIDFQDAAIKYIIVDSNESDVFSFKKNDKAKESNIERINNLIYEKSNDCNSSKVTTSGLGPQIFLKYQFFGRNPAKFFADPQNIKIFNQQHLAPDTLMYFFKNHQNINNGQKPLKKDFHTVIEQDIYHYFSLLYSFERLLNVECQIPLFNLAKLSTYLSMPNDRGENANLSNSDFILKTIYQKEHWFKQFIPLLINQDSMINDYTIDGLTKSSKTVSNINTKTRKYAVDLLGNHIKTIADFDAIYNTVFHLCFIMNKTRAIPTNLGEIIKSIENKLNPLLNQAEIVIDPLYSLYEDLYIQKEQKHVHFWGPRLLQASSLLPEKIFDAHISLAMKEKITLSLQEKEYVRQKIAQELRLECSGKKGQQKNSKNTYNKGKKQTKNDALSSTTNSSKNTATTKTDISVVKNKKKSTVKSKKEIMQQEPIITVNEDVEPIALTVPFCVFQNTVSAEDLVPVTQPCLLFNKQYFERLTDSKNKELYDHYHGIPSAMISDIINNGATLPSPKDESATIFFEVAAVRTVLQKYFYYIACVITGEEGAIFHLGLHKEQNAVKTLGLIASAKIKEFKDIIDWPSLNIEEPNAKSQPLECEGQEFFAIPTNSLAIPLDEFDKFFPYNEKIPSNYGNNTKTYTLVNGEELIFMKPNVK